MSNKIIVIIACGMTLIFYIAVALKRHMDNERYRRSDQNTNNLTEEELLIREKSIELEINRGFTIQDDVFKDQRIRFRVIKSGKVYIWDGDYISEFAKGKLYRFDGKYFHRIGHGKEYIWEYHKLRKFSGTPLYTAENGYIFKFSGEKMYTYNSTSISDFAKGTIVRIEGISDIEEIPTAVICFLCSVLLNTHN